ncbi:hypothetical protein ACFSUD_17515 [Sulfitobacter aestuarii]|uniref:FAD synthase n=1 Tax=Sulfitobacter aestuarii TaxID=2161676 RepID=A0ABW5U6D1_9RHOB
MIEMRASSFDQSISPWEPRIFNHELAPGDPLRGGVLMLGNFDGFHRGHRALAAQARRLSCGRPVGMMSCEPHPRAFFRTEPEPFRLTTPGSKARMLTGAGVDFVYQPHFDGAFAGQTPEEFVQTVLVDGLGVSHVVVGPDFRFGCKRAGDLAALRKMGQAFGFGVSTAAKLACKGSDVSSTRIRKLIRAGQMAEALELLGGHWIIETTRGPDGDLRMEASLCQPCPGRYRARVSGLARSPLEIGIDIETNGGVLPRSPLQTAERLFFQITGQHG